MKKRISALLAASLLAVGVIGAPIAPAAAPEPRGPHNCQGYDVSNWQATQTDPQNGHPFGELVSGFAGKEGPLVGYVRGAANCGNN
jgi:hypothetical protein